MVGSIDYGTLTKCYSGIDSLWIKNISTTDELVIHNIAIHPDYTDGLSIAASYPTTLPSNGEIFVKFRYDACSRMDPNTGQSHQGYDSIPITVSTNLGTETTFALAFTKVIPVELWIENHDVKAGEKLDVPIWIRISNTTDGFNNFGNANITDFEIVLRVDRDKMFFDGSYSSPFPSAKYNVSVDPNNKNLVRITGELPAGIAQGIDN